jgi:hypothetical protein
MSEDDFYNKKGTSIKSLVRRPHLLGAGQTREYRVVSRSNPNIGLFS